MLVVVVVAAAAHSFEPFVHTASTSTVGYSPPRREVIIADLGLSVISLHSVGYCTTLGN